MRYRTLAGAALTALPLLSASSAQATPCISGVFSSSTVCSVGPLTFENFSSSLTITQGDANNDSVTVDELAVDSLTVNQGNGNNDSVTIDGSSAGSITVTQGTGTGNIVSVMNTVAGSPGNKASPFTSGNEFGLAWPTTPLYSSSITGGTASVDLHWAFDVIGAPISDAFLASNTDLMTGTNGSVQATVTETLNGVPLTLNAPGSTTINLAPVTSLHVDIQEIDMQSGPSTVTFGGLTAAFSVPEPGTLALLGTGLAGLGLWRRKRKLE